MKAIPTVYVDLACRLASQYGCWLDAAGIEEPRWRGSPPIDAVKWHTMIYWKQKWYRIGGFQSVDIFEYCPRLEIHPVSEIHAVGVDLVLIGHKE